jgi:hypothetical protein
MPTPIEDVVAEMIRRKRQRIRAVERAWDRTRFILKWCPELWNPELLKWAMEEQSNKIHAFNCEHGTTAEERMCKSWTKKN